jgi:tRNA (mo5U34)-methyltransferase
MELPGGLVTPGWNDPKVEKLPYFGLPDNMTGMRVLDIGHAEGFFSFEAERRGAAEVVGIENYPPMARKFQICRTAFGSRATSHLAGVYDISPKPAADGKLFSGLRRIRRGRAQPLFCNLLEW